MQSTSLAHATLLHLLRNLAAPHSDFANCTAFTYLSDGESISSEVTYAQLDDAARRLAARIQEHTNKGDRVLLVFPSCFEYVVAFYACVYAGVIAVPTVSAANTRTLDRLRSMVDDARPALALTLDAVLQSPDRSAATTGAHDFLRDLKWLATDAPHTGSIAEWNEPALTPDDVVFLQYTSGSTGTPKGVEVTHAALLANARLCRDVYGLKEGDVFVSWVPPYHDFGLIGAIVVPVFVRGHSVQFPPASFLRRPYRWLKLISDFRARITGAPNFAYQLCAKRVSQEEKQTLDLGCLELAINGAERVRAETVRSFQEAFGSAGLRSHVMTPAYGMAESVLLVTANMNKHMDLPPAIRTLDRTALERGVVNDAPAGSEALEAVLTGSARTFDHRVAIVDPATMTRLPENRVGEIWVQGPSVARGYWGKYQESEATFSARLTQESGTWLRSGDLGFVDSQGLYVTGRMKEVMNFGGRKLYPQDVELTIERLDEAFRPNGCATFSLEDGPATQLVVIQEVESHKQPTTNELIPRLRSALAERHEIFDVAAVLLVRPGTVPRTSSGKIQRLRCSELFRQQSIKSIWSWSLAQEASQQDVHTQDEPSTSTARTLLSIWQEAFHNNNITVSDNFFHLGGHSLQAAQMIARIQAQFCVDLPLHIIFRAPTPVALAREIDTAKAGSPSLPPIEASHLTPQHMPLSFAQQRFWFLNQYQPGNAFYNVPCVLEIDGAVDTAKLEMALNALAARHQPLRTQFRMFAGEPEQVILDKVEVPLLLVDLLGQDDAVVASRIEEEARREVQRPFDLSLAPLLRATLIRRSPTAHVLLLTAHHIVCDGWSIAVMLRDLSALYGASGNAGAAPVAPLRVQFSDVVSWERRHFDGAWLGMRTSFWTRYLDGAPQLLELATDRARTPTPRQHGAAVTDHLPRTLAGALTELGSAHHATLFMTMVAAMNALLFRLTGQHDFCTGIMSANRPQGTEALVGNFINVMPLRSRIDGAMPYAELLRSNANDLFLTYEHQIPFEHLMRSVLPDDSGRRQAHRSHYTPYLQLVLNFHNELDIDQADLNWAGESGLKVAGRHPADVRHAAFEIKVEIQRVGDGLRLVFEYDTELFDREAVEQLARHYRVILEAVAAEPQRRIGDLPLMGGAEQRAVLMDWNDTHIEWPAPAPTLAEAFEAQVRLTPDAIAVSFDREPNHEPLTYGALNARANRLAHHLREHGVGPDRLVAVCMERSVDMIVALLGVLKAGGAYVPLDPAYPAERLAYLLGDTAAAVLITQSHLPCAPHLQHAQTVYLDGYETAFAYAPDHNPAGVCTSSHLAYCIYTSGSTGNPKGALNTHGAIVNRLLWMQHEYGLGPNDTVLQKTPFTFDVSVWEFFWPLLNGARLVIAKPEGHKDPAYLADAIQRHRVTTLHFVPSMLQAFLNAGMHLTQHALRQVFCSGEALPCALQQQFHRHFNPVKLHNLYGPTEAAVDVTFWHCEPGGDPTAASVPIGRPVANTRMYVLDGELRPVPPGVEGDLFIGGVQLARGYLKRPGLTAEKFIPNPYGVVGSRLYRTGDRARYRRDGVLEFLGRSDDQVKLRGLRIEPGEIENALQAHPDVLAAAVAVKGGTQGELYEAQLVGYVVMRAGRSLDNAALRAHLLQCLPDYMVPGIWMCLDALPLNANGKLERKRLPEPDGASREASVNGTPYVAPRTPTETMLATLWAELLGVERVGIDDNFFELGGHSLLATQVIARLTDCFPRALTMRTLFDSPTIAAIARVLDAEPSTEGNRIRRMPAIQRQKRIGETQSIQ